MKYYPVGLDLNGKNVLVVGAGCVAERKVKTLLAFGARITLVAPEATPYLVRLHKARKIRFVKRVYRPSDIKEAGLVIAATSDKKVNAKVSEDSKKRGVWVNVVDAKGLSDFISLSFIRKEKAIIAIHTDGRDPKLSRDLKNYLKENWNEFLSYRDRS